jgi:hypothetical protein
MGANSAKFRRLEFGVKEVHLLSGPLHHLSFLNFWS